MMEKKIAISTGMPYEVLIGKGLLPRIGSVLAENKVAIRAGVSTLLHKENPTSLLSLKAGELPQEHSVKENGKVYVITDDNVHPLYFETAKKSLSDSGFTLDSFILPHGENSKSMRFLADILEDMAEKEITGEDTILALGGGVVGDISGFAAAVYLRGIDYFQVPTTFLSAIDSSVGGKTAVNLSKGKNLAGAFKQPIGVLFDIDTMSTLSDEVFADGTAEAIKYGVLKGGKLFETVKNLSRSELTEIMTDVVAECVEIKGDIVKRDEFDKGERRLLNLGHTIGHGIEKLSNFSFSHGKAVGLGMAIMAKGVVNAGFTKENGVFSAISSALTKHNLPLSCDFSPKELYTASLSDKKRSGSYIHIVVPMAIGRCEIKKIPVEKCLSIIEGGLNG